MSDDRSFLLDVTTDPDVLAQAFAPWTGPPKFRATWRWPAWHGPHTAEDAARRVGRRVKVAPPDGGAQLQGQVVAAWVEEETGELVIEAEVSP